VNQLNEFANDDIFVLIVSLFRDIFHAERVLTIPVEFFPGLDLLPILPRALPSGSAVAVVGQKARPQQDCQNGRFFLLIHCLKSIPLLSDMHKQPVFLKDTRVLGCL
jgi:hypothetical protein